MTAAQILIKRKPKGPGCCTGCCQRYCQRGIGSCAAFVLRSVGFDQKMIDPCLVQGILSDNGICQTCIDIFHCFFHTLAQIFLPVSVPQLHSLKFTCGCSGRHHGSSCVSVNPHDSFTHSHFRFHRRIPPGIKDLSCMNFSNRQIT